MNNTTIMTHVMTAQTLGLMLTDVEDMMYECIQREAWLDTKEDQSSQEEAVQLTEQMDSLKSLRTDIERALELHP